MSKKLYVEYWKDDEDPASAFKEVFEGVKGITISVPEWVAVQDSNDDVTYIKSDIIKRMHLENDFLQGL